MWLNLKIESTWKKWQKNIIHKNTDSLKLKIDFGPQNYNRSCFKTDSNVLIFIKMINIWKCEEGFPTTIKYV